MVSIFNIFSNNRYISNNGCGKSVDEIPIMARICSSLNTQNYARPFPL